MRFTLATLAFAVLAAADPIPQGVTSAIAPSGTPEAACSPNYNGVFEVIPVNSNTKRSLEARQNTQLGITLEDGILKDPVGRQGYVASNSQFQFDDPPQAGAIYTAGFSVCANGSLAIGNDATWYKCLSGTFFNLYLDNDAGQCTECYLVARPVGKGGPVTSGAASASASMVVSSSAAAVNGSSPSMLPTGGASNGTMSSSSMAGTSTRTTTRHTGGAGQTTGMSASSTGAGQTTTGGGAAASQTSAAASSSTGAADVVIPAGSSFGFLAAVLALLAI
ncbi:uncharacterized protein LTR77_009896 [Saxophila tyrrhenica]|uniref:Cell wall mannoprotein PIR1-like C-terminal domain-containing protein n=1 Tax=Saxophila tyrrhenica TaxID=1690608 RepID=A0AAV9NWC1_9PEZI|nr:hypothetical protein LTR77_009896 [Saxophila tyrrhenica]